MMRRTDLLINHVRRATENVGGGISDHEFIQYLNDAQDRIQSLIFQTHPESDVFASEGFIDLVAGQEKYSLTSMVDVSGVAFQSNIFAVNAISSVERSANGDYYPMNKISNGERGSGFGYILRDNQILVAPVPGENTTRGLRITYFKKMDWMDKRRGLVSSATSSTIVLNTGSFPVASDTDFVDNEWISVVDKDGNVLQQDIRVTSFSTPTITCATTISTSVVVAGTYVVIGRSATSHSKLPDTTERYLLSYTEHKVYMRDSSLDLVPQERLLTKMEEEIVDLFADNQSDAAQVPIGSTDYMDY